ncbi:hemin ABC transporter substrate-binding protein [Haematobacter massiliensis]|uniref:Hemin ABC transporter substrate-binding protein n=2 Tax=Haematobacter massiliensis TaxID=195105 RepID=A0A086YBJ8_9RHOB|nr:hemin ABC transporter substrate-binding protein [Haematobacter massiliensis]
MDPPLARGVLAGGIMDPPPAHGIPEHERRPRRGAIPVQPRGLSLGAPPATARPGVPRRLAALALTLMVVTAPLASAAETAQRIVSVGGSVTEVIYALGAQDRVIARDSTSTFPPEVMDLPDVGYVRALSPEGLLAVDPDLILAEDGAGPPETVAQLKAAAVPFVTVPNGWTAETVGAKIRAVGAALGLEGQAKTLAADVTRQIIAVSEAAAARPGAKPRALFVLSTQGGRIMASGTGTQAAGMLALAGAENAVTEFSGYKPLTDEAVIAAAPDVIVMMDRGGDHGATADTLFALPAMALTPAGKTRALVQMDGLYLLGFGPRTGAAVEELSRALHAATDG